MAAQATCTRVRAMADSFTNRLMTKPGMITLSKHIRVMDYRRARSGRRLQVSCRCWRRQWERTHLAKLCQTKASRPACAWGHMTTENCQESLEIRHLLGVKHRRVSIMFVTRLHKKLHEDRQSLSICPPLAKAWSLGRSC